jgi:hypothetical protein
LNVKLLVHHVTGKRLNITFSVIYWLCVLVKRITQYLFIKIHTLLHVSAF